MKTEQTRRGREPRSSGPLFPEIAQQHLRSILVLRPGAIGDVLLTTPALGALRQGFPESHIAVLVTASGKAVLSGNPHVDEIIVLDKSSLRSQVNIIPLVRKKRFELVIDFLCNPRTALISLLSGARYRLGYDVRMRRVAYNMLKPRDEYSEGKKIVKYAAEVNADMVRCLGIGAADTGLRFGVGEIAQRRIDSFLSSRSLENQSIVCISPAGSWPAKTWEVEKFAALADRVVREGGLKVVIAWGPGERELAEEMARLMKTESVVACRTGIDEVGALIQRCALFVSNDSGLKHIAVALGTRTVTVFGPTNPKTWNPPGPRHKAVYADVDCLFCDKNECESMKCMKELGVAEVFSAVDELLDNLSPAGQGGARV